MPGRSGRQVGLCVRRDTPGTGILLHRQPRRDPEVDPVAGVMSSLFSIPVRHEQGVGESFRLRIGLGADAFDVLENLLQRAGEVLVRIGRPENHAAAGVQRGFRRGRCRRGCRGARCPSGPAGPGCCPHPTGSRGSGPCRRVRSTRRRRGVWIRTRGSSTSRPFTSVRNSRFQSITSCSSSATSTIASGGQSSSTRRRVKPKPSPPMRIRGLFGMLAQASSAICCSDDEAVVLINCTPPTLRKCWPSCSWSTSIAPSGVRQVASVVVIFMDAPAGYRLDADQCRRETLDPLSHDRTAGFFREGGE